MMKEVIWFGRGGQGAVVAAQILAESAYLEGFKGVTSAPTFGPERRGAPVKNGRRRSAAFTPLHLPNAAQRIEICRRPPI
jgi:Pyruvate/2-oxoacid:ferredoxin oxidoreductase gamma subunit